MGMDAWTVVRAARDAHLLPAVVLDDPGREGEGDDGTHVRCARDDGDGQGAVAGDARG